MKILHVVHQYAPDFVGGTELYTATLATEQVKRQHTVSIFVPSTQSPDSTGNLSKSTEDGIDVYRALLGPRSANRVFADTIFGSSQIMAAFEQVLADVKPDIVHIQHLMGVPAAVATVVTQANIPYVVTLHDYWYGCANAQLLTNYDQTICAGPNAMYTNCGRCAFARAGRPVLARWMSPTLAPLMAHRQHKLRTVLANAKSVIPPTRFVQTTYQQMGFNTSSFVHIPHGIELPINLVSHAKESAEKHRAELSARLVVTYVGGISPQKGLTTLIQAFNQLPEDATLTIYGDLEKFPDYVSQLRQLISHAGISLAGRLPHAQIWETLATADFVAIPTHWYETYSLIIDEAFAVNTPILASNIGAVAERIRHDIDGLLIPKEDVEAWRKTLQSVYDDQEIKSRLQANIRPTFALSTHVDQVLDLY
ncbi:MAG: glycosyltransferase family 4 protein [Anaerolineae bacterium]